MRTSCGRRCLVAHLSAKVHELITELDELAMTRPIESEPGLEALNMHDLFRKPVPISDQVGVGVFAIML